MFFCRQGKSGVEPSECLGIAEHIATKCGKLRLQGLMTIGSPHRDMNAENPDFKVDEFNVIRRDKPLTVWVH